MKPGTSILVAIGVACLFALGLVGPALLNVTIGPSYNTRVNCRDWAKRFPEEFNKDE